MSFLVKPAHHFECYHSDGDFWKECSQKEVCSGAYPETRPIQDDEYLDNWMTGQKNFLCEDKFKIGLIASMYFVGIVTTILIVPCLSDKYFGRKTIFVTLGYIFSLAFVGVTLADNIT